MKDKILKCVKAYVFPAVLFLLVLSTYAYFISLFFI